MAVGESRIRKDARGKVTGAEKFVADLRFPGMLHARPVMSPHPRADIDSIDIDNAKTLPGVHAVLKASDIPGTNVLPLVFADMPFMAEKNVNYHGQVMALCVAETEEQALAASRSVSVSYSPKEAVLSIEESCSEQAPIIYGDDNVIKAYTIKKGDVDKAFSKADHIVEDTYKTPYQEHAYLETQGMLTVPESDGSYTVYGSMQCPFYVRDAVAAILGLPLSKVKVIQAATGGGFGGKEDIPSLIAAYSALLAWKTGRPVMLVLNREEDLIFSSKRHPGLIRFSTAFDKDGKITGQKVKYYMDAGAYATLSPIVLWRGTVHAGGPYDVENVHIETFAMATNLVPCGAYRGFGTPQVLFAHEGQIDDIAEKTGKSSLEIRKLNLFREGSVTATGHELNESVGMEASLDAALEKSNYNKKLEEFSGSNADNPELRKGIGISTVFYGVGLGAGGKHLARSGAFMQLNLDGSLEVALGHTEMGQGFKTVTAQVASEATGVPYDMVRILEIDTSRVPDSGPTVASRATFMSGNAIIKAADELKQRMLPVFKEKLGVSDLSELSFKEGFVSASTNQDKKIAIPDLAKTCINEKHIGLSVVGWYSAPDTTFAHDNGQGDAYFTYTYATNIAEVSVNIRTGEVQLDKLTASLEVGKAINPQQVEGQIQGGALQGAGYAITEEILHDKGIMKTTNFSTYIIPTAADAPEIVPVIVEKPFSSGPFGAKGFGELPLMGVAPAVAGAVRNATGIKFSEIPLTPERVWAKLKACKKCNV